MNLPTNQFNIQVTKDTATVDSLTVAKGFGKLHKTVLRDIKVIIQKATGTNLSRLNSNVYDEISIDKKKIKEYFIKSEYIDSKNEIRPM